MLAPRIIKLLSYIIRSLQKLITHLFNSLFGSARHIVLVASIALPLIIISSELVSVKEHNNSIPNIESIYSIDRIKDTIKREIEESHTTYPIGREVITHNGMLTTHKTIVTGTKPTDENYIEYKYINVASIKNDSLVSFLGIWAMIVYTIFVFKKADLKNQPNETTHTADSVNRGIPIADFACKDVVDHITAMKNDLVHARRKANDVYQRSTLLLVGGVIMAFVGIGIFYNSTPIYKEDSSLQEILLVNLRPTLMLVFIEALAWFLLKQYRALADEHRYFNKLASNKSAYLVALLAPNINDNSDLYQKIIISLLQDEAPGILQPGQTTERLENTKLLNSNPVFDFYSTLLQMFNNKIKDKQDG